MIKLLTAEHYAQPNIYRLIFITIDFSLSVFGYCQAEILVSNVLFYMHKEEKAINNKQTKRYKSQNQQHHSEENQRTK